MAGIDACDTAAVGADAAGGGEERTGDDGTADSTEAEGALGEVGEVAGGGGLGGEAVGRVGGGFGGVFEVEGEISEGDGGFGGTFCAGDEDVFCGGEEAALEAGVDAADGLAMGCGALLLAVGGLVCRLMRIGAVSSVACSCSQSLRKRREEPAETKF